MNKLMLYIFYNEELQRKNQRLKTSLLNKYTIVDTGKTGNDRRIIFLTDSKEHLKIKLDLLGLKLGRRRNHFKSEIGNVYELI